MTILTKLIVIFLLQVLSYSAVADVNGYKNSEFLSKIGELRIFAVAPASGTTPEIIKNINKINAVKMNNRCFENHADPFHSNIKEVRFNCLKEAIYDNETDIIWAIRGGSGASELIASLKKLPKPTIEKFFVGYSDMTALHLFLTQEWGWKTIHGAMLKEIFDKNKDPENLVKVANILIRKSNDIKIDHLKPLNDIAANFNEISAKITGGNLEVIRTSIGTDWQINVNDKILFLEDVNIHGYELDRNLEHLLQAGVLLNAKAIIFGVFNEEEHINIKFALKIFAGKVSIPVFKTNKIGHGKINYPLIYNSNAQLKMHSKDNFVLTMKVD